MTFNQIGNSITILTSYPSNGTGYMTEAGSLQHAHRQRNNSTVNKVFLSKCSEESPSTTVILSDTPGYEVGGLSRDRRRRTSNIARH